MDKKIPSVPSIQNIQDPAVRQVLQALVDGWSVRNGHGRDGGAQFVTREELETFMRSGQWGTPTIGGRNTAVTGKLAVSGVADLFREHVKRIISEIKNSQLWKELSSRIDPLEATVSSAKLLGAESMRVATETDGSVRGSWTVKFDADGYVVGAGLGLEGKDGNYTSEFLVKADRFAIGTPGETPVFPFIADANGVYIQGSLYVNNGGPALEDLAKDVGIAIAASNINWYYDTLGQEVNPSITLVANLRGGMTGNVTWSKTGTGTTPPTAGTTNTWTIYAADQSDPVTTYTATLVQGGITYTQSIQIGVVSDGAKGDQGVAGTIGSLTGFGYNYGISSTSWSDDKANRVIYNMLMGESLTTDLASTTHLTLGDTVTLSNGSSFAATKYWSGTAWLSPGTVIDGNLLVTGTVTADKITAGSITTGYSANASITIGDTTFLGSGGSAITSPFHTSKSVARQNQTLISARNDKDDAVAIWGSSVYNATYPLGNAVSGTWHASSTDASNGVWSLIGILGSNYLGAAVAGSAYNSGGERFGGWFRAYSGSNSGSPGSVNAEAKLAWSDGTYHRALVATGPVQLYGANSPLYLNTDAGTAGYVLKSGGAGVTPYWAAESGGGSVTYASIQTACGGTTGSKLDLTTTFRSTGANAPTSGSGMEVAYYAGTGILSAGTRDGAGNLTAGPLTINGSTTSLNLTATTVTGTSWKFNLAPTLQTSPATSDNSTKLATTAYVVSRISQDAPTKTGTGASGSWGISVTGSSASCTGNAATATKVGGYKCFGGSGAANASGNLTVTFPSSFSADATLGVSAISTTGVYVVVTSISLTSVTFQAQNRSAGAAVAGAAIRWTAVGTTA